MFSSFFKKQASLPSPSQFFIYQFLSGPRFDGRHLARGKHGMKIAFTFVVYLFSLMTAIECSMCPIRVSWCQSMLVELIVFKASKKTIDFEWMRSGRKTFFIKRLSPDTESFLLRFSFEFFNEFSVFCVTRCCCAISQRKVDETRPSVSEQNEKLCNFVDGF